MPTFLIDELVEGVLLKWAPQLPDVKPCDFFLLGHIKSRVYATKPLNLLELKEFSQPAVKSKRDVAKHR